MWDTSLCFMNSHLAAHDDMCARRNDDFAEIVGGCKFGEKLECTQAFHHLVWMGDLNYRCEWGLEGQKATKKPSKERVKKMIAAIGNDDVSARTEVFKTDQLTAAIAAGDAFLGFQEGDPATSHMPTFKVQRKPGYEYKDQRTPAWCDRVLWKTAEGISCRQTMLTAAGDIGTSDHKAVAAALSMEIIAHPATVHFEDEDEDAQLAGEAKEETSAEDVEVSVAGESPSPTAAAVDGSRSQVVLSQTFAREKGPSLFQTLFGACCGGAGGGGGVAAGTWVLRFSALSAKNLISADINGMSDPYIVFLGPLLAPPPNQKRKIGTLPRWKTSTIVRSLNPTWTMGQVPTLPLVVPDANVVRREYLSFRVMDEDTLSMDDPIGYGRLFLGSLGDAMAAGKEGTVETTVMLTLRGRRAGELSLKVTLEKAQAK